MIRKSFTVLALASPFLFPWIVTVVLALSVALFEPLIPVAVGTLVDALYHVDSGIPIPIFMLSGAVVSAAALFVRRRLKTGIIKE